MGLGHCAHPPSSTCRHHRSDVTYSCSSPPTAANTSPTSPCSPHHKQPGPPSPPPTASSRCDANNTDELLHPRWGLSVGDSGVLRLAPSMALATMNHGPAGGGESHLTGCQKPRATYKLETRALCDSRGPDRQTTHSVPRATPRGARSGLCQSHTASCGYHSRPPHDRGEAWCCYWVRSFTNCLISGSSGPEELVLERAANQAVYSASVQPQPSTAASYRSTPVSIQARSTALASVTSGPK